MNVPLEIAYRNVPRTDTLEDLIREKAAKLNQVHDRISSCRVAVEKTQFHQDRGNPYRVRVDITVPPGHEIFVVNEPGDGNAHDELSTIVRQVFKSAWRRLREMKEVQSGNIKVNKIPDHPEQEANAVIEQLNLEEGFGFLRDVEDGEQVYFHPHSVVNEDFEELKIGFGVHYMAELGENGLQATTVRVVSRPSRM